MLEPHLTIPEILARFERGKSFRYNVTARQEFPARKARLGDFPEAVDPRLRTVLANKGIRQLFSHQRESYEAIRRGENTVVVTPTASGKTLCYNLPVLQGILEEESVRALYLFPTKALSQDQMHELHDLITGIEQAGGGERTPEIKTFTYDGDTPQSARRAIRSQGHVVITNPDMLHTGILPHHTKWLKLFRNLRYIVIDELHYYRGIFGSHFANVLRRLLRICEHYGSRPILICSSATIANPRSLAERLTDRPFTLIDNNGAPQARKTFYFYNPPVVNKELGIRANYIKQARNLARLFIEQDIQTIIFALSRLNVEVLTKYFKDRFGGRIGEEEKIAGYRGGYLPKLRRQIERGIREGKITGVVSTNALELGIDIGSLSACVIAGYPGSIANNWQQVGRAGRRGEDSVAFLVARSNPLDQYIVTHPEYFFEKSPENALINPNNITVLMNHIKCAAFELPFREGESFGGVTPEDVTAVLEYLQDQGLVQQMGTSPHSQWHWTEAAYPAQTVNLRSIAEGNFVVVNRDEDNRILAEVDYNSVPQTLYEDAIYLAEGQQYVVEELDWENRKAFVRATDSDYFTDAIDYTNVRILDEFERKPSGNVIVEHGEVHLVTRAVGFKKIKFYTSENVGYGKIELPDQEMVTTAYWFTIPEEVLDGLPYQRADIIDGLLGMSYVLHYVASLSLMCEISDIDRAIGDRGADWFVRSSGFERGVYSSENGHPDGDPMDPNQIQTFRPAVFLYDNYPGGVGFSPELYDEHEILLQRALEVIRDCRCEEGCPSCVGPTKEVGVRSKEVAVALLQKLL